MDDNTETPATDAAPLRGDAVSIRMKQTTKVDGAWRQTGETVETTRKIASHLIREGKAVPADVPGLMAKNRAVDAPEATRETAPKKPAAKPRGDDKGALH